MTNIYAPTSAAKYDDTRQHFWMQVAEELAACASLHRYNLLLGDFNAHLDPSMLTHTVAHTTRQNWNQQTTTSNDVYAASTINVSNCTVTNFLFHRSARNSASFHSTNNSTLIDYLASSPDATEHVQSLRIRRCPHGNYDHYAIICTWQCVSQAR